MFEPDIKDILLAGECFLEARLEKKYFNLDDSLKNIYDAYNSAAAFSRFMSSFTYQKNNQED